MSVAIPFTTRPLRLLSLDREPGRERIDPASSATLLCELETITPLCINSAFKGASAPYIPAASIRGMVRAMVEALGASCLRLMKDPPPRARIIAECSMDNACIACRMFGFTVKPDAWAAKVAFTDALPQSKTSWSWVYCNLARVSQGQPPPLNGWALFPHTTFALRTQAMPLGRNPPCLAAGSKLHFRVDYLNLDPESRSVLLFALTLSHNGHRLCHKIGYAKALGLGACTIRLLNPNPPSIGPEIDPYLNDAPFKAILAARSIP